MNAAEMKAMREEMYEKATHCEKCGGIIICISETHGVCEGCGWCNECLERHTKRQQRAIASHQRWVTMEMLRAEA